jgi:hypothetical protein
MRGDEIGARDTVPIEKDAVRAAAAQNRAVANLREAKAAVRMPDMHDG